MKCMAKMAYHVRNQGMKRSFAGLAGAVLALSLCAAPAKADLKLCNKTDSRVGIAVGYKDKNGWATEGWWKAEPASSGAKACTTIITGKLIAQYYYIYAVDYSKGGSWGGQSKLCIRDKIFTIRGFDKCEERGYKKVGFTEVNTGEEDDWTITLSGEKTTPPSAQDQGTNGTQNTQGQ
jgi:uncharacterized membrane protein